LRWPRGRGAHRAWRRRSSGRRATALLAVALPTVGRLAGVAAAAAERDRVARAVRGLLAGLAVSVVSASPSPI
jgi:hypothetical protein